MTSPSSGSAEPFGMAGESDAGRNEHDSSWLTSDNGAAGPPPVADPAAVPRAEQLYAASTAGRVAYIRQNVLFTAGDEFVLGTIELTIPGHYHTRRTYGWRQTSIILGADAQGRPIVVFCPCNLASPDVLPPDLILEQLHEVLRGVGDVEYVAVVFGSAAVHSPGITWFIRAYRSLERKYRKNLMQLYLSHPTAWLDFILMIMRRIISPKFFNKMHTIDRLSQLAARLPLARMRLPVVVAASNYALEPDFSAVSEIGAPLGLLFQSRSPARGAAWRVPRLVRSCVAAVVRRGGLATEGIFRRPPRGADVAAARRAFDLRHLHVDVWGGVAAELASFERASVVRVRAPDAMPDSHAGELDDEDDEEVVVPPAGAGAAGGDGGNRGEVGDDDNDEWFPTWALRVASDVPLVAAVLLMRLLRATPEPLVPAETYDALESALAAARAARKPDETDDDAVVRAWRHGTSASEGESSGGAAGDTGNAATTGPHPAIRDLLFTAPPRSPGGGAHAARVSDAAAARWVLACVTYALHCVAQHAAATKMPARNLATVVAPNLVRGPDPMRDIALAHPGADGGGGGGALGALVRVWIARWDECWGDVLADEVEQRINYMRPVPPHVPPPQDAGANP